MHHPPTGFALAAARGIGLTLSGHRHNGQIWPFNYIVGLFYLKRGDGVAFMNLSEIVRSNGSGPAEVECKFTKATPSPVRRQA